MEKIEETFNKDLEELKSKQTMMNNTVNEIKNSVEGINSRITEAEERISDLEDKIVEITTGEQNKEKRTKRIEDSLRDLWDNIKCTNFVFLQIYYLFVYFCLCWIFVAVRGLSLVVASGGCSSLWCMGFSLWWLLLLWSTDSRRMGFSSCGTWAQ